MELTEQTLVLIRAKPVKDKPTTIDIGVAARWNVPNQVSESKLHATINAMCADDARDDMCSVVERNYMGEWNDDTMTEYVFACGEPYERFAFFFDSTPAPNACPFCGRLLRDN